MLEIEGQDRALEEKWLNRKMDSEKGQETDQAQFSNFGASFVGSPDWPLCPLYQSGEEEIIWGIKRGRGAGDPAGALEWGE